MLARRLPWLLPPPTDDEALEIATIASAAGARPELSTIGQRPFRAPHHSCSDVGLIGGGDPIRPGEVTLAHGGVLFLDELPELRRGALEALRPTMESGQAVIVRARERACMPAKPLIVAAMNPCPCGYQGHPRRICRCSIDQVQRYRTRISGPLLDRFDLHVALPPLSAREVEAAAAGEASAAVRQRVCVARTRAAERERWRALHPSLSGKAPLARLAAELEPEALRFLHRGMVTLELSLRAYAKVLKVSRTIADLAGSERVQLPHIAEAIQYRAFDREPSANGSLAPALEHGRIKQRG
jgi:magnesium chelatase family protein